MDSREYTAEDLALDEQFQRWVSMPLREPRSAQRDTINRAIMLVRQAGLTQDTDANAAFLHVWNNIRTHIDRTSH